MFDLYISYDTFTSGYQFFLLILLSIFAVLCGVFVITSKNPIVSVLYLIGLFLGIACYLSMLGINFIGLSYLLVYVGAVSILFLFILMLINIRVSELITDNSNSIPLAIMIGIFFTVTLLPVNQTGVSLMSNTMLHILTSNLLSPLFDVLKIFSNKLQLVSAHIWDGALAEITHITVIGNILYTAYPLWLIITSLILLLAMVGAIIITLK